MSKKESQLDKKYFIKENTETKNFPYQDVKGKKTVMFGRVHRHSNYRTYRPFNQSRWDRMLTINFLSTKIGCLKEIYQSTKKDM
jgi:hypothetical protein